MLLGGIIIKNLKRGKNQQPMSVFGAMPPLF